MKNVNGDEGDWRLSMESYAAIKNALAPGAELDGMNRVMVQNVASSLDNLEAEGSSIRVGLAQWLRKTITKATTNSVYGPLNPYRDEAVQNGFWCKLEQNLQSGSMLMQAEGISKRLDEDPHRLPIIYHSLQRPCGSSKGGRCVCPVLRESRPQAGFNLNAESLRDGH